MLNKASAKVHFALQHGLGYPVAAEYWRARCLTGRVPP